MFRWEEYDIEEAYGGWIAYQDGVQVATAATYEELCEAITEHGDRRSER